MRKEWAEILSHSTAAKWALTETEAQVSAQDSLVSQDLLTDAGRMAAVERQGFIRGWRACLEFLTDLAKENEADVEN